MRSFHVSFAVIILLNQCLLAEELSRLTGNSDFFLRTKGDLPEVGECEYGTSFVHTDGRHLCKRPFSAADNLPMENALNWLNQKCREPLCRCWDPKKPNVPKFCFQSTTCLIGKNRNNEDQLVCNKGQDGPAPGKLHFLNPEEECMEDSCFCRTDDPFFELGGNESANFKIKKGVICHFRHTQEVFWTPKMVPEKEIETIKPQIPCKKNFCLCQAAKNAFFCLKDEICSDSGCQANLKLKAISLTDRAKCEGTGPTGLQQIACPKFGQCTLEGSKLTCPKVILDHGDRCQANKCTCLPTPRAPGVTAACRFQEVCVIEWKELQQRARCLEAPVNSINPGSPCQKDKCTCTLESQERILDQVVCSKGTTCERFENTLACVFSFDAGNLSTKVKI